MDIEIFLTIVGIILTFHALVIIFIADTLKGIIAGLLELLTAVILFVVATQVAWY